jgi:hypothetical protein
MTVRNTVVGVFHNHHSAQQAVNELKRAGFTESEIGVVSRHHDVDDESNETYVAEGGAAGLATGAGIGALWGLGIVAGVMPVIGPAIAGGTLAAILSSAAAGAAAAGVAGALVGLGVSKEEAEFYEDEVEAGRTVVTVRAASRSLEAERILRQYGAYDMRTPEAERMMPPMQAASTSATGEVAGTREFPTEHKTVDVPVSRDEVVIERDPVTGVKRETL